jgi:ribosomal protein S18 acetylase RimI-like enzyme
MPEHVMPVTLRAAGPEDEPFLLRVYASTRLEELAPLGWSAADQDAFLRQQGEAQHHHYRTYYMDVDYSVILSGGQPAGRLYVARWPQEIRIVDIALLPEYRNAGIGTRLIGDLLAEAERTGRRVTIHVESFNPAQRLYERLGFRLVEDKGMYRLMQWSQEVSSYAR